MSVFLGIPIWAAVIDLSGLENHLAHRFTGWAERCPTGQLSTLAIWQLSTQTCIFKDWTFNIFLEFYNSAWGFHGDKITNIQLIHYWCPHQILNVICTDSLIYEDRLANFVWDLAMTRPNSCRHSSILPYLRACYLSLIFCRVCVGQLCGGDDYDPSRHFSSPSRHDLSSALSAGVLPASGVARLRVCPELHTAGMGSIPGYHKRRSGRDGHCGGCCAFGT